MGTQPLRLEGSGFTRLGEWPEKPTRQGDTDDPAGRTRLSQRLDRSSQPGRLGLLQPLRPHDAELPPHPALSPCPSSSCDSGRTPGWLFNLSQDTRGPKQKERAVAGFRAKLTAKGTVRCLRPSSEHKRIGNVEVSLRKRRSRAQPAESAPPGFHAPAASLLSHHGKRLLRAYYVPGTMLTSICLCGHCSFSHKSLSLGFLFYKAMELELTMSRKSVIKF